MASWPQAGERRGRPTIAQSIPLAAALRNRRAWTDRLHAPGPTHWPWDKFAKDIPHVGPKPLRGNVYQVPDQVPDQGHRGTREASTRPSTRFKALLNTKIRVFIYICQCTSWGWASLCLGVCRKRNQLCRIGRASSQVICFEDCFPG